MSEYTDLDMVVVGHPVAAAELARLRAEVETLEHRIDGAQRRTDNAVTEANSLRAEVERMREVVDEMRGLALGVDWNNGTHAKFYRPRLVIALARLDAQDGEVPRG